MALGIRVSYSSLQNEVDRRGFVDVRGVGEIGGQIDDGTARPQLLKLCGGVNAGGSILAQIDVGDEQVYLPGRGGLQHGGGIGKAEGFVLVRGVLLEPCGEMLRKAVEKHFVVVQKKNSQGIQWASSFSYARGIHKVAWIVPVSLRSTIRPE